MGMSLLERMAKHAGAHCRPADQRCINEFVSKYIDAAVFVEDVLARELNRQSGAK